MTSRHWIRVALARRVFRNIFHGRNVVRDRSCSFGPGRPFYDSLQQDGLRIWVEWTITRENVYSLLLSIRYLPSRPFFHHTSRPHTPLISRSGPTSSPKGRAFLYDKSARSHSPCPSAPGSYPASVAPSHPDVLQVDIDDLHPQIEGQSKRIRRWA